MRNATFVAAILAAILVAGCEGTLTGPPSCQDIYTKLVPLIGGANCFTTEVWLRDGGQAQEPFETVVDGLIQGSSSFCIDPSVPPLKHDVYNRRDNCVTAPVHVFL